jgi:hypothetical protein
MRIWLDDDPERDPPTTWTIVRTADDAIRLLSSGETVEVISLDRDLGDQRLDPYPREITGEDVVRWMVVNKVFPKFINVHSHNYDGGKRMVLDLQKSAPPDVVIKWWRFDVDLIHDLEKLLQRMTNGES